MNDNCSTVANPEESERSEDSDEPIEVDIDDSNASGRGMQWNCKELLYLAMSWVATTVVPEQSELAFWENASRYAKTNFGLQRSKFSMRDKWKKVQTKVQRWNGHYDRMKMIY